MAKEEFVKTVNYNLKESHFFIVESLLEDLHKKTGEKLDGNLILAEIFEMGTALLVAVKKEGFDLNQLKDVFKENEMADMLSKLVYEAWKKGGEIKK